MGVCVHAHAHFCQLNWKSLDLLPRYMLNMSLISLNT